MEMQKRRPGQGRRQAKSSNSSGDRNTREPQRDQAHRSSEPEPLHFVQVPELALTLPAHELQALIGLLRFCHTRPECWPLQETLAAVIDKPSSTVGYGIRGLIARGAVARFYFRTRKGRRARYLIAPGYWVPHKKPNISATTPTDCRIKDSTLKKEGAPHSPSRTRGETPPLDDVDQVEGAGIEAEPGSPVENRQDCLLSRTSETPIAQTAEVIPPSLLQGATNSTRPDIEIIVPGETGSRPYRNRKPRPEKVWDGKRWRRPPRQPRPDRPSPAMVMMAAGMQAAALHDARDGITPNNGNIISLPPGPEYVPPGCEDLARYRPPKDSPATMLMKGAYTAALNADARERGEPVPYPSILEPILQGLADEQRRAVERRRA